MRTLSTSVIVMVLCLWPIDALSTDAPQDTVQRRVSLDYTPNGTLILGVQDGKQYSILQYGWGVTRYLTEDFSLRLALPLGAIVQQNSLVPYMSAMLTGNLRVSTGGERFTMHALSSISYGTMGPTVNNTAQIVAGLDCSYRTNDLSSPVPLMLTFTPGIGYDVHQDRSGVFLNAGVRVADWLSLTFDLASLFSSNSMLMHMGRLR